MPPTAGKKDAHRSDIPENWFDGQKRFCVVLEEIRSDIETPDSFTIKFSLLTKTPISKMKHIVNNLPAPIWSGQGKSRAENILALIDEAGGRGSIVEGVSAALVKNSAKDAKNRMSCRSCGFPLKEGDTHCEFCMTPVADIEKGEFRRKGRGAAKIIARKRILCYVLILVAGIIFAIVTR
jgi:hypothetical protein